MKLILKYLCASFLILVSGMISAQTAECLTFDVDFRIDIPETSKITGKAVVEVQGTAFKMTGNGIESYCDGSSVWTVDQVAKEVYIESISPDTEAYMKDLSLELSGMKDDDEATFVAPDGQPVHIKVNSIKKSAGKDIASFRPTQTFDSSWIITDLR